LKISSYLKYTLFFLLFVPLLVVIPSKLQLVNFQNFKYLILSIFNVISISYTLVHLFRKNTPLKIKVIDLLFFAFVLWSFLSCYWSENNSYALFYSFAWLNGFLFYKNFDIFFEKKINIKLVQNILSVIFCITFFIGAIYAFSTNYIVLRDNDLIKDFRINANGFFSILLCLFPFLLIQISKSIKGILALIISAAFIYFLLRNNVQTAKFTLIFICSFYFFAQFQKWNTRNILIVFLTISIALIITFYLNTKYLWWIEIARYRNLFGLEDRLVMWQQSIELFKLYPFTGIGIGNWSFEFHQASGFVKISNFTTPHNLYLRVLSELGLIGFLLFLLTFIRPIIKLVFQKELLAFASACISFLFLSSFFGITNFNYNSCGSAILVFLLAIASSQKKKEILSSKFYSIFFLILSGLTLTWFIYNFNVENKLLQVRTKTISEVKTRIALVEDMYHPTRKTHFKNIPLPYYAIKDIDNMKTVNKKYAAKRDSFYQLLNIVEPSNTRYQHMYAEYIYEKGNLFEAKKILQKLISQSENYLFSRLLLAKIEVEFGNYNFANALLNFDSIVFEKALKIENRFYSQNSKKLHVSDQKFLQLNNELIQLQKKIKRKLRQQKLKNKQ